MASLSVARLGPAALHVLVSLLLLLQAPQIRVDIFLTRENFPKVVDRKLVFTLCEELFSASRAHHGLTESNVLLRRARILID